MLDAQFKGGAEHPRARDASAEAHADMNAIYTCLTLVVPGLAWLSNMELKKEDISALGLLRHPDLDRPHKTGFSSMSSSNAGFRQSLLKQVKEEFTPAAYNTFKKEMTLLQAAFNVLK